MSLPGDYVECGVSTGITSRAVVEYCSFGNSEKSFYLVDTFSGIPMSQASDEEKALSESKNERHYFDSFSLVQRNFIEYSNVYPVRGTVPDILGALPVEQVAFLHIDMNIAYPEVAALEHFWPLMVPGGIVILDDYGAQAHVPQKRAIDSWSKQSGANVLLLPTGQGMIVR